MDRNIFPILPKTACKWNSHRLSYRKNCGIALITFYNSSVDLSVRCKVSFFSMMTSRSKSYGFRYNFSFRSKNKCSKVQNRQMRQKRTIKKMVKMSLTWPEGWIKGTVCFFFKSYFHVALYLFYFFFPCPLWVWKKSTS